MNSRRNQIRTLLTAAVLAGALAVLVGAEDASAQIVNPCARADEVLATTGRGDSDHDDISNCAEVRVTGTNPRDFDTDSDNEPDGTEIDGGTDPVDSDSDDDGVDDGTEIDDGTDPSDADSDNDGEIDGADDDPGNDLGSKIEGQASSLTCPDAAASIIGEIVVLGISIALDAGTDFDGADNCAEVAAKFGSATGVAVEVEVGGTLGSFVALEVEVEDADTDGSDDDEVEDADGDGEDDEQDEGEEDEEDEED